MMKMNAVKMPRKPKFALITLALIAGWILLQMSMSVLHQLNDVPQTSGVSERIIAALKDIVTKHYFTERLYNGFILYVAVVIVYHFIVQFRSHAQLRGFIQKRMVPYLTRKWNDRYRLENVTIIVVKDPSFIAAAFGLFRPKILLSTYVLSRFGAEEIEAILLHEIYHCRARHPLQAQILNLLNKGLFFIPVIKELTHYYSIWMELLADRYTIYRMKNESPIGHVLLALLKDTPRSIMRFPSSSHFANEAVNYRIEQIIEPSWEVYIPSLKRNSVLLSVAVLILLALLGIACDQLWGLLF